MSFLKRILGSTDAVEDARSRAVEQQGSEPAGWNVTPPEVTQTDDEVIVKMTAPGLDPSSLESEVDGDALVLKARGDSGSRTKVSFNERFQIKGADLSQASVSYEDEKIVLRIPTSSFPKQSDT